VAVSGRQVNRALLSERVKMCFFLSLAPRAAASENSSDRYLVTCWKRQRRGATVNKPCTAYPLCRRSSVACSHYARKQRRRKKISICSRHRVMLGIMADCAMRSVKVISRVEVTPSKRSLGNRVASRRYRGNGTFFIACFIVIGSNVRGI